MDRQKKLLIFAAAWLSAAGLSWFVWAKTVAPQVEKKVRVVVAARDMPLGTLLRQNDLKVVDYAERDIPKGVVFQAKDAIGRVLLFPAYSKEPLLVSKLSAPTALEGFSSTIEPGYRAVSVQITDASGVAGLVQPNSHVDVLFTRPGTMAEATTSTILQNIRVLSVGKILPAGQTPDPRAPKSPVVTLVLTPDDAQKLELAKNQGKISLSLRNPLDAAQAGDNGPVTAEVLDPLINARIAMSKKGRVGNRSSLTDPEIAQQLNGEAAKAAKERERLRLEEEARKKKEADKPRVVVDVYRGDKHVQEMFK